jgi:hypothetical protein
MRVRGIAVFLLTAAITLQASEARPAGQDDAEIERWISELVHSDPARRTDAEKKLIKAGPKALPALKKAFESKTADLATRAKAVAAEIERLEFERQYDATERPRRLEIVTLQIKDATLGEAIKTLGSQVDSTLHTTVDAKQKLTIDVKDVPIRKCLDQIEDALKVTVQSKYGWHKVVAGASTRKKRAYVPGVTFEFSLTPFKPEGQAPGWSLQTEQSGTATVFVESIEVLDSAKAAVQIERCGRCGPRFVLLKTDKPGPFTVRLKGRLVWESPYDLQVTDPAKAQDFKVGPFAIKYEWPKASWTASDPVPDRLIGRAELVGKLNKKLQGPGGGAMGVGGAPPEPRPANAWCACATGPAPFVAQPPIMLTSGSYVEAAYRTRKPEQFDSMKVRFYKGIEETFEAEASVSAN